MARYDRSKYRGDPWEQQPWDTKASLRAFNAYLLMGPDRSLEKASAAVGHKGLRTVRGWSADHDWQYRVLAWENAQRAESVEKMRKRTQEELQKFYDEQLTYLKALMQNGTRLLLKSAEALTRLEAKDMSAAEAAACARAGAYVHGYAEKGMAMLLGISDTAAYVEEHEDAVEEYGELEEVG